MSFQIVLFLSQQISRSGLVKYSWNIWPECAQVNIANFLWQLEKHPTVVVAFQMIVLAGLETIPKEPSDVSEDDFETDRPEKMWNFSLIPTDLN